MRDSQTFFAVILGSVDIASEAVTTQILKHEKKQEVVVDNWIDMVVFQ